MWSIHKVQKKNSKIYTNRGYKLCFSDELDKACFAHDAAYSDSKNLTKRTQSSKVLKYKGFEVGSNPKYDGYQRELASIVYRFFDKKSKVAGIKMKLRGINN